MNIHIVIQKLINTTHSDQPRELGDEKFSTLWKLIKDDHQVDAVVIDTDVHLAIAKLLRAQLYLQKNPQCLFLVGTTDMILSIGDYKLIGKRILLIKLILIKINAV